MLHKTKQCLKQPDGWIYVALKLNKFSKILYKKLSLIKRAARSVILGTKFYILFFILNLNIASSEYHCGKLVFQMLL